MRTLFSLFLLLSTAASSFAHEDSNRILGPEDDVATNGSLLEDAADIQITPQERYARTQEVLKHFNVPADVPAPHALDRYAGAQTAVDAAKILSVLDPTKQFSFFFDADASSLTAYLDKESKRAQDFQIGFAASPDKTRPTGLADRLRAAARGNSSAAPLRGLRIALDPGHMGTDEWDEITGKFVLDAQKNRVSEGLINLQTCILLGQQLTALGATVKLTHDGLAPVWPVPYKQLSLQAFGQEELKRESLQPWFQGLIQNNSGAALAQAFDNSPQVKKLFSEIERGRYFAERADLAARAQVMRDFHADIMIILHHDTGSPVDHTVNPKPLDGTKTYVVGDFEPGEFATQALRTQLVAKMTDREGWNASYELGHLVVNQLKQELGVPFSKSGGGTSYAVEPGLFARNLGIPSQLDGAAVTYVEAFFYDDPNEFRMVRDYKHQMEIGGMQYPYSDRLATTAHAVAQGVLSFVASYGK